MYKNIYSENLALGYVIPKQSPTSMAFLANLRDYNDTESDIKKQIKLSNEIYRWEGIVTLAINTSVDFTITQMSVKGLEGKALEAVNFWLENVNLAVSASDKGIYSFSTQVCLEWFLSGNAFLYENWSEMQAKKQKYLLPSEIILLNPKNIDIPEESLIFGKKVIKYQLTKDVSDLIEKKNSKSKLTKSEKLLVDAIPKEMLDLYEDGFITFEPGKVTHLKRRGRNYLPWGVPYLTGVFNAVAHKRKLQLLDQATMEGLINRVTIFKIGDAKNEKTWGPARLSAFKNLLVNPSPQKMLVWAYDVEVEDVVPNSDVLSFENKYVQADRDILYALGVPADIIVGKTSGDQFTTIATFMERLSEFRDYFELYLKNMIQQILVKNNLYKDQNIRIFWGHSRLRNAREIRELVLTLWDRGLISIRTALEESGQDVDLEKERKDQEIDIKELFSPPVNPFVATQPKRTTPNDSKDQKNTKTAPPKTQVTDTPKASAYNYITQLIDTAKNELTKIDDENKIFTYGLSLQVAVDAFVKDMIKNASTVGITIDDTLESSIKEESKKFMFSLNDAIDKNEDIPGILDSYGEKITGLVENSMSWGR